MIHPKVASASISAALTVVLVWLLGEGGVEVPPMVASAITTLFAAAGGYMKSSDG